jgi:hypothetical protein
MVLAVRAFSESMGFTAHPTDRLGNLDDSFEVFIRCWTFDVGCSTFIFEFVGWVEQRETHRFSGWRPLESMGLTAHPTGNEFLHSMLDVRCWMFNVHL